MTEQTFEQYMAENCCSPEVLQEEYDDWLRSEYPEPEYGPCELSCYLASVESAYLGTMERSLIQDWITQVTTHGLDDGRRIGFQIYTTDSQRLELLIKSIPTAAYRLYY